jgi:hypothetical protein
MDLVLVKLGGLAFAFFFATTAAAVARPAEAAPSSRAAAACSIGAPLTAETPRESLAFDAIGDDETREGTEDGPQNPYGLIAMSPASEQAPPAIPILQDARMPPAHRAAPPLVPRAPPRR